MSNMKTVSLNDATLDQLKEFATNTLGLEYHTSANKVHMLAMIRNVHDQDSISVVDAEDEAPLAGQPVDMAARPAPGGKPSGLKSASDPRVTIMIPLSEKEGGDRHIEVLVNGRNILLPRGKDITIPYRYYEALNNAVKTEYRQDPNDPDHEVKSREVPSYPFQVKQMPSEEEVAAWKRAQ